MSYENGGHCDTNNVRLLSLRMKDLEKDPGAISLLDSRSKSFSKSIDTTIDKSFKVNIRSKMLLEV